MSRFWTALPLLLAAALPAQEFTETFPDDMIGVPQGWTISSGAWEVLGGRLVTDGDPRWHFVTLDGFKPRNSVIDVELGYYPSGVQFCGPVTRFTSVTDNLLCKLQENTTASQDFDHAYVYERPNSSASALTFAKLKTKVPQTAFVRFITRDSIAEMQIDADKDGIYEQVLEHNIQSVFGAGLMGICIFGFSEVDNFEYFNAILQPAAGARPRIGTSYTMDVESGLPKAQPFRVALSGGNDGFPIGDRRLPLSLDPIFDLSISAGSALGLVGMTDVTGKAQPTLQIPNATSLVGVTLFASAITLDPARPMGIDRISNEIGISFQQ